MKARVFTKLFYRHWDSWVEGKRQHLFVVPAAGGEPRDLTPGDRDAYPTSSTFSAGDDFTFTPDSLSLVYTAPAGARRSLEHEPRSVAGARGGRRAEESDCRQPGGRWLSALQPRRQVAGLSGTIQAGLRGRSLGTDGRAGRWRQPRSITSKLDLSFGEFAWGADNASIFCIAEQKGETPIFKLTVADGQLAEYITGGSFSSPSISFDGKKLACSQAAMVHPADIMLVDEGKAHNLSHANRELMQQLELPRPESVSVKGAGGTPMQMWIVKPPGFDPTKKWPLVYLVHGGPQGAWEDGWSYRWNPELWAAQGYVVALPNPRGSTGFGQQYVDEISGDWGGKCYEDLMAGVDYLERLAYIDTNRMAAAGASFGGYMMNWFEGHTNKFKTLITHCGVYNFDSMYATTDELWFDEWEHGGPPWGGNRESYEKHSPHRFAQNFKTPMLIIHNDNDFRVPMGEGYQLFTTLQRLGVPSRMINFPDESHWVLKPANSVYWHKEVFDWLKKYVKPGAS